MPQKVKESRPQVGHVYCHLNLLSLRNMHTKYEGYTLCRSQGTCKVCGQAYRQTHRHADAFDLRVSGQCSFTCILPHYMFEVDHTNYGDKNNRYLIT